MGRLGIDLSGDAVILASVNPTAGRLQLRDYERLESNPDMFELTEDLRRARRQHRFPRRAEVVAWPGDLRVNAVREAGFKVERVILPGEALERVARMHHGLSGIPGVTAVLSVDPSGGALAIVRDTTVLQETALTWSSSGAGTSPDAGLLRRYAFLSELTESLGAAFSTVLRTQNARVHEILTCGSFPDLRSLTMPLADEFDVEVETLDSISGIDVRVKGRMPEEIADALPTLWIAMVASRRWHPKRRRPVRTIVKVAVPVGLAAGVALLMFAGDQQTKAPSGSRGPTTPPTRSPASSAATSRAQAPPAGKPAVTDAPRVPTSRAATSAAPVTPPQAVAVTPSAAARTVPPPPAQGTIDARAPMTAAPVPAAPAVPVPVTTAPASKPVVTTPPVPSRAEVARPTVPPPQTQPVPSRAEVARPTTPPPQKRPIEPQRTAASPVSPSPVESPRPVPPAPRAAAPVPQASAVASRPAEARPSVPRPEARQVREQAQIEVPATVPPAPAPSNRTTSSTSSNLADLSNLPRISLPLTSILWSAERQLVVANGQTLEVGDTLSGMRIVRIEQDSVIVRDRAGRLRRAPLR